MAAYGPPPVLYLLHGLSDDHTAWLRYTSIERYADEAGLAVVMPAVDRRFYANEGHGHAYWDFVSEELPQLVGSFLRFSEDPAETFVAGLSMGGYGALKHAFNHPDRYAAAASLSGAAGPGADHREGPDRDDDPRPRLRRRGRTRRGPLRAARRPDRRRPDDPPAARLRAATEDWLFPDNQRFAEEATAAGVDVTSDFRPGDHEWGLWDAEIRDVIAWLGSRREERTHRRRRAERLLRGRFAAGDRWRPGGGRDRRAAGAAGSSRARTRPTTRTSSPPATTTSTPARTGPPSPTTSTRGRSTARSAPPARTWHDALQPRPFDAVFLKGRHQAAYSGFEGRSEDGDTLADWLRRRHVTRVDVCGIATDHCVRATALDAVASGFETRVLTDLCVGVAPETTEAALAAMREAGVSVA